MFMNIKNIKKLKIPNDPGVYFFLKGKSILYIGKATSLKDRVKSYFPATEQGINRLEDSRGLHISDMVFQADKIKWEKTDSVLEALILEAELIKKHQPKYNTKEKSDKSFNYVCITNEEIPKVLIIRGRELQAGQKNFLEKVEQKTYKNFSSCALPRSRQGRRGTLRDKNFHMSSIFGPYTNGSQLKEAMKIIRRIFPFIDESSSKKQNQEFYKQIKLTPATLTEYKRNIRHLKLFFQGKKKQILKDLQKEMMTFAKKREFEKAGEIKRQIFALKHINDVALIKNENLSVQKFSGGQDEDSARRRKLSHTKIFYSEFESVFSGGKANQNFRIEAYDVAHMSGKNMVGGMTVVEDGEVNKNEYRKFKINTQNNTNDTGTLGEVINRRLMHLEWTYPNLIVVDGGRAQINIVERILKVAGINIPVVSVLKDERHKPKNILGKREIASKYEKEILLTNSEAHRFAINYHKSLRNKNFLK